MKDTWNGADAVLIVTEWSVYQELTPELLKERMRGNLVVDGRNCLDPRLFTGQIRYIGVGRNSNFALQATAPSQMAI